MLEEGYPEFFLLALKLGRISVTLFSISAYSKYTKFMQVAILSFIIYYLPFKNKYVVIVSNFL